MTQQSLRQAIGVVPQETVLFNEDVHYNIKYGSIRDGEPRCDDKAIVEASVASQLHEKVCRPSPAVLRKCTRCLFALPTLNRRSVKV